MAFEGGATKVDSCHGPFDGLSCDVDGRHLPLALPSEGDDLVEFLLDGPDDAPEPGVRSLPGMGRTHHVRIWLPCLSGCAVGRVMGDGTFVRPVSARRRLLVIGDSIAQGFVAGDPALSWPSVLSLRYDLDLANQGIGGQVFQAGVLTGLSSAIDPAMTLEGCVVRVSDIIAYVGKDRQDAVRAGICDESSFDDGLGGAYNAWALAAFSADVIEHSLGRGRIGMSGEGFAELSRAKRENYEKIYGAAEVNGDFSAGVRELFGMLYEHARQSEDQRER